MIVPLLALSSAFMAPAALHSKLSQSAISMGGKGFGGGEATRDPEPTAYDPNDPKGKQQAIHKAESFSEYLAKRAGGAAAPTDEPAAAAPAAAGGELPKDGVWSIETKTIYFDAWDPESPRTYMNFNPFERNDESAQCDMNGCFPGQSRGYKSPIRPAADWDIMQKERAMMDELAKNPKFGLKGKPGCFSLGWQKNLGAPP